jgi:hypothetical protein
MKKKFSNKVLMIFCVSVEIVCINAICCFFQTNVGAKKTEPWFIRVLMTAVAENSISGKFLLRVDQLVIVMLNTAVRMIAKYVLQWSYYHLSGQEK